MLTACLTVVLYIVVPKGFFPQQDTGRVVGSVQADQDISFAAMSEKMQQFVGIVSHDPNVKTVVGFAGGNTAKNQGRMFITLNPRGKERKLTADQVRYLITTKLLPLGIIADQGTPAAPPKANPLLALRDE